MAVARFEITRREPYAANESFGGRGPYERIDAIAHYAVDPTLPGNDRITDLSLAERKSGKVNFAGDVTLLVPQGKANGGLLVNLPNRGNRTATRVFNRAPFELVPTDEIDPGDGFLMRHRWIVAFCGWQWDAPKPGPRMGITPPQVPPPARSPDGNMHLRIQPNEVTAAYPLTDHHVGSIGQHRPIPTRDVADKQARLLVRTSMYGEAQEISHQRWQFARDEAGTAVSDAEWVRLEGGFQPGLVYDLIYVPRDCPVVGTGLLAIRDLAAFLRRHPASPVAGRVDHVIGEGISQCGRLMRTFLGLGLNTAEDGGPSYDGLLIHVAGGRRGEFNMRYGQPSVQPTPALGHLFPFADNPTDDPVSGQTAGLLDLQRAAGNVPKIFTDTSSEYWRGDASLAHIAAAASRDLELPDEVRRYLYGSTQHTPAALPFADLSPFGSHGSNWFNVVDYRPLHRSALMSLLAWIRDGRAPPPSVYPVPARYFIESRMLIRGRTGLGFLTEAAIEEYVRCYTLKTITGSCRDYRACATTDLVMDTADKDRKLDMPLLLLWGARGQTSERAAEFLDVWRRYATKIVAHEAIPCGHYIQEEMPEKVLDHFTRFFGS